MFPLWAISDYGLQEIFSSIDTACSLNIERSFLRCGWQKFLSSVSAPSEKLIKREKRDKGEGLYQGRLMYLVWPFDPERCTQRHGIAVTARSIQRSMWISMKCPDVLESSLKLST